MPVKTIPNPVTAYFSDSKSDAVRMDASTHTLQTIQYAHHEIHSGSAYTACKVWTLPAGGSSNILIVTSDTPTYAHFVYESISDDVLTVNFYESPDYSGGAALAAYNRNRNSFKTSGLTLTTDATDDGGGKGTLIWTFKAGANRTVTAAENTRFEFILKRNTEYLFENVGALNDVVTSLLNWYEHEDKD